MADQVIVHAGQYAGGPVKEDVLQEIYQITPEDTPFYNMIGDSQAVQPVHEWNIRALSTRGDNAVAEGDVYTIDDYANPTLPSRIKNIEQILRKMPRITGTAAATAFHAISDLMADQVALKMVEFKTDVEHALLRGSLNSGPTNATDTTARRLGGFHNVILTNSTEVATPGSLGESNFNDDLQTIWDAGGRAQDVLAGGKVRRDISGFTASHTRFEDATSKKVTFSVKVYESDFQIVTVHLSRDVVAGTGASPRRGVYYLDRSFFAKAWLRRPFLTTPKMDKGDDVRQEIMCEVTLEYGHQGAAAKRIGLT